jgi:hypothetical protein
MLEILSQHAFLDLVCFSYRYSSQGACVLYRGEVPQKDCMLSLGARERKPQLYESVILR